METEIRIRQALERYDNQHVSLKELKADFKNIGADMVGLTGLKGELVLKYHINGQPKELKLKSIKL